MSMVENEVGNITCNQQIKVGIIAAPERAAEISHQISSKLADQLSSCIDDKVNWHIETIIDPLTGAAEAAQDILYNANYIKQGKEWDYAICLTDLPIFYLNNVVAADISIHYKVAQISIPAYGWVPMKNRIKKTIIQLLSELYYHDTVDTPKLYNSVTTEKIAEKSITHLFKRQFPIMPIRRQENPDITFKSNFDFENNEYRTANNTSHTQSHYNQNSKQSSEHEKADTINDNNIDVRFLIYPKLFGYMRLLLGMTFANNPLKIMSSFKNVIAIAFTTGAFALIFPTIWKLGQIFSFYRLTGMMFAAIFGLVGWIILAHNLWESPSSRNKVNIRRLYNITTTFTLLIDVVAYFTLLFILFFLACLLFIPIDYFESMIHDYNHISGTLINYMRVAWASASIATIVSAIGAGLENEELVRDITYGYRQKRRYNELNKYKNS